jgi:hypothetical protein
MASDPQSLTEFLNVDLDLRGDGLEELLGYLGSSVVVMHQTAHELALELSNRVDEPLDETLAKWIELLQSLPEPGRVIWNRCNLRSMNIGIQSAEKPYSALFTISSSRVSQLASLQAEIVVTVYAPIA